MSCPQAPVCENCGRSTHKLNSIPPPPTKKKKIKIKMYIFPSQWFLIRAAPHNPWLAKMEDVYFFLLYK